MRRVSIAGLMAIVLLAALGSAALGSGSGLWCSAIYSLTLMALGLGLAGSILARGAARAFCVGFALFGCGYIYLALDATPDPNVWVFYPRYRPEQTGTPRPPLVTTKIARDRLTTAP